MVLKFADVLLGDSVLPMCIDATEGQGLASLFNPSLEEVVSKDAVFSMVMLDHLYAVGLDKSFK